MRKILLICLLLAGWSIQAQESRISVQAAHSDYISKTILDENRNLMISYGNYSHKNLKFWDRRNGVLLKNIETAENVVSFDVDKINGKTYLGTKSQIIVYNNNTLKEEKRYKVEMLNNVAFRKADASLYFITGDWQDNVLHKLDTQTGTIDKVPGDPFPNNQAGGMQIIGEDALLWISSGTQDHLMYSFDEGKYLSMPEPPLAFFKNMDFLFVDYMDDTHVKVVRWNGFTQKDVWERTVVIEKITNFLKPTASQVSIQENQKSLWIAPGQSTLLELNADTGEVMGVIYNNSIKRNIIDDGEYVYALEVESDQLFAQGNYNKYRRYSAIPVARFGHTILDPTDFHVSHNSKNTTVFATDKNGRIMSLFSDPKTTQALKYDTNFKDGQSRWGTFFSNNGSNQAYYVDTQTEDGVCLLKVGDKQSFKTIMPMPEGVLSYQVDSELHQIAMAYSNRFEVYNLKTRTKIFETNVAGITSMFNARFNFSKNGQFIALSYADEIAFEAEYAYPIAYYDATTKKMLWSLRKGDYDQVFHVNNDTQLLAINVESGMAEILDAKSGSKIREFSVQLSQFGATYVLNPTETKLLITDKNLGMVIYDIASGKKESSNTNFSDLYSVNLQFVTDNILAETSDGVINFFRLNEKDAFAQLIFFRDGEWIVYTPEGRFDGSQNAWNRVVYVKGRETISLDRVFDKLYTPRLLHKLINGTSQEMDDVDIDDLKDAPTVQISYTEGGRNLTVEDDINTIETQNANAVIEIKGNANGDRITELRLFHNNKLVSNNTRNLTVEDDVVTTDSKSFAITLLPGENRFRAVAINSQQTESAPEELLVTYAAPKEEKPKFSGIQTHLIVIGIDAYKNPKYNLNYAVADATSFQDALKAGITPITSNVNVYNITNADANREKILETFKTISANAKPQDVLVFYYAGHGMVTQDQDKQFYLVPHDVTQIYGASEGIKQKGISAAELKKIAATIPAQKQLYILDACQSGGALGTLAVRGAAEEKAIAQLARSTGTHWLTASGSEQYATEFDQLGHGVFTYALLEALSGKADSGDNRVTVNELKAYLESRVPEISQQYKGSPQYPSSFGFGQDFPISVQK